MSRHRAFQNYDYENDLIEYDGDEYPEEEENELSPEDKVQMAEGTSEVRRVLADQADMVTTQQIQDALWHYYYDVDKSVAYLINKFIDPAPLKPAATKAKGQTLKQTPGSDGESLLGLAFSCFDFSWPTGISDADCWRVCANITRPIPSAASFFIDMPWNNIPTHRRTVFIAPPRPRGGLLGGSSGGPKMSKLQALAAARKKRTQETRKAEETGLSFLTQKAQSLETTIGRPQTNTPEARNPSDATNKATIVKESPQGAGNESQISESQRGIVDPAQPLSGNWAYSKAPHGTVDNEPEVQKGNPSEFAQTLLPFASAKPLAYRRLYPLPWMIHTTMEALREVFEKPSPDDVVLAAQSQAGRSVNKGR